MKLKKLAKKGLLILALLIMSFTPIFSGCFDFSIGVGNLPAPTVTLHKDSKCITWPMIANASMYEIYVNDRLVGYQTNKAEFKACVYEFTEDLGESGDYNIKVVAVPHETSSYTSSKDSNVVTYSYSTSKKVSSMSTIITQNNNVNEQIAFTVEEAKSVITFIPADYPVDGYELYLYSESTGLNVYPISLEYPTNANGYNVYITGHKYNLQDEIYAVRIGVVIGNEHIVSSEIKYFNPDSSVGTFTEEIYHFDGQINDVYIESLDELRNLIYYDFAYKKSSQAFCLSNACFELISAIYTGENKLSIMQNAIIDAYDYFYETRESYSLNLQTTKSAFHEYQLEINYRDSEYLNAKGKAEPETSLRPPYYVYEDIEWDTFYDTCGYTMRKDDVKYTEAKFDNFASDNQFLYYICDSSEELYWCVENKVAPHCRQGTSAERIYKKAKEVLNSIISDQMNDYEKVQSIFDWICDNTSYDYYSLSSGCYGNSAVTLIPSYYLEGVFDTGYAVCDGFSKAFSLLCNMEGIDCIRIVGFAGTGIQKGGHAWNKVLVDPVAGDENPAEYYVVDITWTELKGSTLYEGNSMTGNEVTSKEYFMITDEDISQTHVPYTYRSKYNNYKTAEFGTFDYYKNTKFNFDASKYNLPFTPQTTTYDLVIESDEELQSAFYYMFVTNKESIELVITYNYIESVHEEMQEDTWDASLIEKMRSKKFGEQYIFINSTWILTTTDGLLFVFENNLLVDEGNEEGHLVSFMSHYNVYGTYDLYIKSDILNKQAGTTELQKVQNLFKTHILNSNINIEFKQITTIAESGKDQQACFEIIVSPKVTN